MAAGAMPAGAIDGIRGDPAGTVGALLCRAGQHLRAAAFETPRLEARLLLAHAMGCRMEDLLRDPRALVPPDAALRFGALLRRRLEREPVAHLLGAAEFWSLPVEVSPATLVPRADSETLIEAALAAFPRREAVRRVLDLGTGTGCLLLAALSEFPHATGVGVERVADAAALARRNAVALGLGSRAGFVVGSWGAALAAGGFRSRAVQPALCRSRGDRGLGTGGGAARAALGAGRRRRWAGGLSGAVAGSAASPRAGGTGGDRAGAGATSGRGGVGAGERPPAVRLPFRSRRCGAGAASGNEWGLTAQFRAAHRKNHLAQGPGGTRFSAGFAPCSASAGVVRGRSLSAVDPVHGTAPQGL